MKPGGSPIIGGIFTRPDFAQILDLHQLCGLWKPLDCSAPDKKRA